MERKEALEVVRKNMPTDRSLPVYEALQTLIPELRESEDKMTCKRAIAILKQQRDFWSYDGPKDKSRPLTLRKDLVAALDVALSCLEKQKEHQNNSDAPKNALGGALNSPLDKDRNLDDIAQDYVEAVKEYNPEPTWDLMQTAVCYGYHYREQKEQQSVMIQWTGKNLKEVIDFTGKSPKFGEWFKSWEDFENYVHSHDDILKLFCEDGSHYEVPVGAWIVKTPDGYNIPSRFRFIQKPAEWSEEDEKMLAAISKALGCDTAEKILVNEGVTLVMAAGFLGSLRPSWKPSEVCYGAKGDPDPAGVWKPSGEQMDALLWCAAHLGGADHRVLAELYEHLKKLT